MDTTFQPTTYEGKRKYYVNIELSEEDKQAVKKTLEILKEFKDLDLSNDLIAIVLDKKDYEDFDSIKNLVYELWYIFETC